MPTLDRICFHCGTIINDPFYLMVVNHSWHLSCLKCSDCGILLEHEQTCFAKHGQIVCKNDYNKKYCSHICTRCNRTIQQDEIILRAEQFVFHLECFTCNICHILLHTGDEFGLRENSIYCRNHFFEQNSCIIHDDSGYNTSPNEIRKLDNDEQYEILSPTLISSSYFIETNNNKSHHSKQKRLRTSFKHNQLRFMRSYFNLNHNPDAKDLKNLSEKTNLPKRVLQVWFQNARAKYRRSSVLSRDDKLYLSSPSNFNELENCILSS
ncbi:unnamed protein product [Adineta steineri]|uniref:Uncharacterized protein n=1 Tax=Adineta steineri TaxID=433720 RepID=A0A814EXN4_9BILA|nr:unnamed protein product [Adineta steineri]CAF3497844.1 unnamed protein product [Adineta steineri]